MPNAGELLQQIIDGRATNPRVAKEAAHAALLLPQITKAQQAAASAQQTAQDAANAVANAGIIKDDGIPPSAPTNVSGTGGMRSMILSWDQPLSGDYVARSAVRLTTGGVDTYRTGDVFGAGLIQVLPGAYSVSVAFVDNWGHQGAFSTPITVTVLQTAADQISQNVQVAAQSIQGTLALANLPTIPDTQLQGITDPSKLNQAVLSVLQNASQGQTGYQGFQNLIAGNLIAAGTMSADRLMTGTITASSGVIANAAIGDAQMDRATANRLQVVSADVVTLNVAKLIGGTLTGQRLVLGGTNSSGNAATFQMVGDALFSINDGTRNNIQVSNAGFELAADVSAGAQFTSPAAQAGRAVFPLGSNYAALWAYWDTQNFTRGFQMRADGLGGAALAGRHLFAAGAYPGASSVNTGAYGALEVTGAAFASSLGAVGGWAGARVFGALNVVGPSLIQGDFSVGGAATMQDGSFFGGLATFNGGAIFQNAGVRIGQGYALNFGPAGAPNAVISGLGAARFASLTLDSGVTNAMLNDDVVNGRVLGGVTPFDNTQAAVDSYHVKNDAIGTRAIDMAALYAALEGRYVLQRK